MTRSSETRTVPQHDIVIVGSGPAGIAAAAVFQQAGLDTLILEKGVLADAITKWPIYMRFFSTADKVELPGLPLITVHEKPTREEYLAYLRRYVLEKRLKIRTGHTVTAIVRLSGNGGAGAEEEAAGETDGQRRPARFELRGHDEWKEPFAVRARYVVVATGAYENPKMLNVAGEALPKVSHHFTEVHPYVFRKVAVIGGRNSAAEAALLLHRAGAEVTLIHRGPRMNPLKFWLEPDLENRIRNGEITAYFNSTVEEIGRHEIVIRTGDGRLISIPNDYVLAMTGYRPDTSLLSRAGVHVDPHTNRPQADPETLETNIPNLYVAGVIVAGDIANEIFIENSRDHGEKILKSIRSREPVLAAAAQ